MLGAKFEFITGKKVVTLEQGFSNSALWTLWLENSLLGGGSSVYFRVFSSILASTHKMPVANSLPPL